MNQNRNKETIVKMLLKHETFFESHPRYVEIANIYQAERHILRNLFLSFPLTLGVEVSMFPFTLLIVLSPDI